MQVNKLYPPHVGGVEEVVKTIAEGLAHDPGFVSGVLACNEGRRTLRERVNGVDVTRVGSLGRLRSLPVAPLFPFYLYRARADIYHFHVPFPLGEASALRGKEKRRMVAWYHSDVVRQKLARRAYQKVLERFLDACRIILVSSPHLVKTSPILGPRADRCRVVPFGIDVDRFRPGEGDGFAEEVRARYGGRGGLVLFVGRLVYYKGLFVLLEAMRGNDASLVLIGEGPLARRLMKRAAALGMRERVHFLGRVPGGDLPSYYRAADLLVLPSMERSEAFGLVLLEAQACGRPVVSTDLGTGTTYANLDGETGLVVPPGDPAALARAVKGLLENTELRMRMGRRGRERVVAEFNREKMLRRLKDIYLEVLEENEEGVS